ncbi:MAG: penicillin-binding transpeptidase domain-containing protein [Chloroflexota bacterium]
MIHNLNRVTLVILFSFAAVMLSLVYWSVLGSDSMLARDDNPRLVETERALVRGGIYDRSGQILAVSTNVGLSPSGKMLVRRTYQSADVSSVVGYYSLVHGVGGTEAAFDTQLRGNDLRDSAQIAVDSLLHHPQVGSDVRLTVDATLQSIVSGTLKGRQGAVIAIEVPSGAILAMVSAPSFDPNTLDRNFDALQADPAAPLLNRVTQGLYQPGGALETPILAAMLADKAQMTDPTAGTMNPVQVDGRELNCASQGLAFSLEDAYALACPALFAEALASHPGPAAVQKMIDAFGLLQAPALANFGTVSGQSIRPLTELTDPELLRAEGAGQGELTVSPFQMVLVAATIANHGTAIEPHLADAVRLPRVAEWQPLPQEQQQRAVVTQDIADTIGSTMRNTVVFGAANAAERLPLLIHGHASIAFTGPHQQQAAWFIGYVTLDDGRSIAVAVVVENADAPVAANIGGTTLAAAAKLPQ